MRFLYLTIDSDGDAAIFTNMRKARKTANAAASDAEYPDECVAAFYGSPKGVGRAFGVDLTLGAVHKVEILRA